LLTGKITLAHLNEIPNYYFYLLPMEQNAQKAEKGEKGGIVGEVNNWTCNNFSHTKLSTYVITPVVLF
jgi:hypothetical protein